MLIDGLKIFFAQKIVKGQHTVIFNSGHSKERKFVFKKVNEGS